MLLVIQDNKIVSKFSDKQEKECQAAIDKIEGSCELIKSVEDLMEYTGKDLATLYNNLVPIGTAHIKLPMKEAKEKVAQKVWKMAKALAIEKPVATKNTASVEKGVKKVGIKQQIRTKLGEGGKFSLEELLVEFGKDKKSTVVTALSDLRSEKYAGEGGALNIVKDEEKRYYLEVKGA